MEPAWHVCPCPRRGPSWQGSREVGPLSDGTPRKFLKDGDVVTLRGACTGPHFSVGFGECVGQVLPAGATPPPRAPPPPACALRDVSLQSYWRSSCSWRVRVALNFYGVPFTTAPVILLEGRQSDVSPMAQVLRVTGAGCAPSIASPRPARSAFDPTPARACGRSVCTRTRSESR